MSKKHPQHETPAKAYGAAREDISNLCKLLERKMDERLTPDCSTATWPDAGTAQHVRAMLVEILMPLLVGSDGSETEARKRIEAELDAMRD